MKKTKMMKKNYEFRHVLSKGTYYSGKYLEAFIKKTKQDNVNFLGIAIGVKLAKAVRRNQIKRLIRENYRHYEKKIQKGYAMVFLWKKKADIKDSNFQNIKNDMKYIFDKAKLTLEE
ncbi:MAG: ribonuclease P protein component [Clostridia bacterium]|nr:ribonuclease P protein component [Clostridia bacterium]